MTLSQETISSVVGIMSIAAIGIGVYNSLRKPQEKSEVTDAVFDVKFRSLEETVINLRDNHIHTIESKLDLHIENQAKSELTMARTVGRIETILDERLPRKL